MTVPTSLLCRLFLDFPETFFNHFSYAGHILQGSFYSLMGLLSNHCCTRSLLEVALRSQKHRKRGKLFLFQQETYPGEKSGIDYGNQDVGFVSYSLWLGFHSPQGTLSVESSISPLPSEASLVHVCRFSAGREGQLYPDIITLLWLSLIPEVLMQIKWETLGKESLQLLPCLAARLNR